MIREAGAEVTVIDVRNERRNKWNGRHYRAIKKGPGVMPGPSPSEVEISTGRTRMKISVAKFDTNKGKCL